MPVNLIYFTAQWQNDIENIAVLDWQTASEQNNSHFEIEQSFDGVEFRKVGEIQGNGTSLKTNYYVFTDILINEPAFIGEVYYRLKQLDYDGKFAYSPIEILHKNSANLNSESFQLFPNPANDGIIQASKIDDYKVYNMQAILVKEFSQTAIMQVADLPSGIYLVQNSSGVVQRISIGN